MSIPLTNHLPSLFGGPCKTLQTLQATLLTSSACSRRAAARAVSPAARWKSVLSESDPERTERPDRGSWELLARMEFEVRA